MHILITGASGSGTSTLAAALARDTGATFLDSDDFFWLPTDPPYRQKRDAAERLAMVLQALRQHPDAVLSGSIMAWGTELEDAFDLVVFLYLDTSIRLARLHERGQRRFGAVDPDFLAWDAQYDAGTAAGRNLSLHRAWLAARASPVLRLEGDLSVVERMAAIRARAPQGTVRS